MPSHWPGASSRSATETFDLILLKSGQALSAHERRHITGDGVKAVLHDGSKSFGDFVFEMLATFGVSDAGDISEEQAHYFIIFLKALVQMGNLRGGVVTGTVSEADALETTESVHYGSIPGSLGVAGSC